MGNCLDSSAKVDTTISGTGVSKNYSKNSRSSAPSSLTIPSLSENSNASSLPTPRYKGEILYSSNLKPLSFNELKNERDRRRKRDGERDDFGFDFVGVRG